MTQTNAKTAVTLGIDSLSYGPYGIGRLDGKAMMIRHTAPGDVVEARVLGAKASYAIGELTRVIKPSPVRQTPPCPYVPACGGCTWQHLQYAAQLKAKQQSVEDALRRIGKLTGYELRPIIPSPLEYHYRRRIRLQIAPGGKLGYCGAASRQVVEIDSCWIADQRLNRAIEIARAWLGRLRTPIEELELVCGDEPGQLVLVARAAGALVPSDQVENEKLVQGHGAPLAVIVRGKDWRKAWGNPAIRLRLTGELSLDVDADVFTQVNPAGNRRMVSELLDQAQLQTSDRVLELYSGAGNFTLPIAERCGEVTAVEGDRRSLANAKRNAQKNGLENIRWICSAVPAAVARLRRRREKFLKIVLDPPRAGAKGLEADLAALGAERLIYVSCNPTTLARDLAALAKLGYKTKSVQPIDLFPQTYHVESLAVVER
jgi:23S rRNA (uracil1939-C5)-methyltransferase